MNHKWEKDKCVRCGIVRTMAPWKMRMAIDEAGRDHYKRGRSWFYGTPVDKGLVRTIGFTRPECRPITI